MTTFTIEFDQRFVDGGRNDHQVWYSRSNGQTGFSGYCYGSTVEEAIADHLRRCDVYGWDKDFRVREI